jgi:hypothetical protein
MKLAPAGYVLSFWATLQVDQEVWEQVAWAGLGRQFANSQILSSQHVCKHCWVR